MSDFLRRGDNVPLYEYECGECRHTFERRQHFNDEPVGICPRCGGKCRRVIHASPVIFKGGDFYASSSRNPGQEAPGEFYKSGDDFFERSGRSREETIEAMKVDAITRKMIKDAGVG